VLHQRLYGDHRRTLKKRIDGGDAPDSPEGAKSALLNYKWSIHKAYGWSLSDIDAADFINLVAFLQFGNEHQGSRTTAQHGVQTSTPPPWW
jgi:hypothetical protein